MHKIGSLWSGFYNASMTESIRTSSHDSFLFNYFICFIVICPGQSETALRKLQTSVFRDNFKDRDE